MFSDRSGPENLFVRRYSRMWFVETIKDDQVVLDVVSVVCEDMT